MGQDLSSYQCKQECQEWKGAQEEGKEGGKREGGLALPWHCRERTEGRRERERE